MAPDQLDATVFDEAVRHARALADAGDDGQADGVLRDALRLWRGEVLNDVATDGLRAGIIHLEELRLGAVEQAVAISVRRGEFAAAVGTLTVEVGRFPFNERLYEQLMTALVGMGRPADALRAYQEVERCLDRELSLRPSLALRQLRREIVAGLDHPVTGPLGAGRLAGPLGREVLGRSARPVSRVGAA
ncbi:MAG TPA: AfsR/SARP family transcriptional regulator [Pilimelia sp.]|nr:AfsR/SARP family transcriptional regulator [Pilimelia sp.]